MTRGNPSILVEGDPDIGRRTHRKGKEPAQEASNQADIETEGSETMAEQNEQ